MPFFDGQLGGNNGGSQPLTVLDDLQEIPPFLCVHGSQAKVIKDKNFGFYQFLHDLEIRAIGLAISRRGP